MLWYAVPLLSGILKWSIIIKFKFTFSGCKGVGNKHLCRLQALWCYCPYNYQLYCLKFLTELAIWAKIFSVMIYDLHESCLLVFMYLCIPFGHLLGWVKLYKQSGYCRNYGVWLSRNLLPCVLLDYPLRGSQLLYHVDTQAEDQIGRNWGLLPMTNSIQMSLSFRPSQDFRRWVPLPVFFEGDLIREPEPGPTNLVAPDFLTHKNYVRY